jgi:hypothetical protein
MHIVRTDNESFGVVRDSALHRVINTLGEAIAIANCDAACPPQLINYLGAALNDARSCLSDGEESAP